MSAAVEQSRRKANIVAQAGRQEIWPLKLIQGSLQTKKRVIYLTGRDIYLTGRDIYFEEGHNFVTNY